MKLILKKTTTSKNVLVFIPDASSSTGAGLTGLAHNTSGLTAYYYREGAGSAVPVSLVAGSVGAYTSGGFVAVDGTNLPGVYQLGLPDLALQSGANTVLLMLKGATNMAPVPIEIQLVDYDPQDGTALGLTYLDATISSRLSVGSITLSSGKVTVGTNEDKSGYSLSAAGVQAIWDALTSALTTANSIGKRLADNVDAAITSRLAAAAYTAPDNATIGTTATALAALAAKFSGITSLTNWLRAIARKTGNDATAVSEIGSTFDPTTDSLEAIRDRGDAAWTTGGGGSSALTAADVWSYSQRTLTTSAVAPATHASEGQITLYRGDTATITLTGLGDLSNWSRLWLTAKSDPAHSDAEALFQVSSLAHLAVLSGTAEWDPLWGTLSITDIEAGTVQITLAAEATRSLAPGQGYVYDLQMKESGDAVRTLARGYLTVTADVTRSLS